MSEKKSQIALLTVALGLWMVAIPLTFQQGSEKMFFSDLLTGLVLILLGILSLSEKRVWSGWGVGLVGVWLQFAPLFFWAPIAFTYLNDTFVGAVLIVFSFLLSKNSTGSTTPIPNPTGWSYNPSSWSHRIPTVGLAILCWFFSRYMAAYQLGYIDTIWDPIFTNGTLNVITSKISHDFPVSDAGLGAVFYTLEAVLGWQGSERRWYTMPWLVLAFGFMVVPVGCASITLIVLQPVAVGSWCAWCLATAACMLLMIVFTAGELVAVFQYLRQTVASGKPFWRIFWKGGSADADPTRIKPRERAAGQKGWGVTLPWNLIATALLGAWSMATPGIFHNTGPLATGDYIIGPLMIALSVIAMAEVFRSVRYLNILLGVTLIALPWFGSEASSLASANNVVVGLLALILSFRKGKISERYGTWERFIF